MLRGVDRLIDPGRAFDVHWCADCHCGTTALEPDATYWDLAYPEAYFRDVLGTGSPVDRLDQLRHVERAGSVSGLRILEVGCSSGDLLSLMRERGADVYGVEPSKPGRAACVARGLPVVADVAVAPEGPFDRIILFDVLEHLPAPVDSLRKLKGLLSPTGCFVIGVPNVVSLEARLLGRRWFALELPRHLSHFSPLAFERIAARSGLAVRHLSYGTGSFFAKSFVDRRLLDGPAAHSTWTRALGFGLRRLERVLEWAGNRPSLVVELTR